MEEVLNAVRKGDEKAKTKLAWLKLSGAGGADVDVDGAVELLEERVKAGDTDAMWMLGVCYEFGMGTEQDIRRAKDLFQRSSDGGNEIGRFFVKNKINGRGDGYLRMGCLWMKKKTDINWFYFTMEML